MDISRKQVVLFQKLIIYGCFIVGIPVKIDKKIKFKYYTLSIACNCFLILGGLVTALNTSNNLYKLEAFFRLLFSTSVVLIYLYCRIYGPILEYILSEYDENSPNRINEEEMKITAKVYFKTFPHQWLSFIVSMVVCGFIAQIFLANRNDIDAYEFMYFYSCGSANNVPVLKFCFERESLGYFVLNDILDNFITIYQTFITQTGHVLMMSMVKGVEAKMKLCDQHLLTSIEEVEKIPKSNHKDVVHLEANIKYQQNILKYK